MKTVIYTEISQEDYDAFVAKVNDLDITVSMVLRAFVNDFVKNDRKIMFKIV